MAPREALATADHGSDLRAPGRTRTYETRIRNRSRGLFIDGDVPFSGPTVGVTGSTDHGWHQFASRMAPRAGTSRESMAQDQVPSNLRPSCSAKSLKSLTFRVARGRS
jgi:hypothetical protein